MKGNNTITNNNVRAPGGIGDPQVALDFHPKTIAAPGLVVLGAWKLNTDGEIHFLGETSGMVETLGYFEILETRRPSGCRDTQPYEG